MTDSTLLASDGHPATPASPTSAPTADVAPAEVRRMRLWAIPGMLIVLLSVLAAEMFLADWPPFDDFGLRIQIGMAAILHVQAVFLLAALGLGTRAGHGRLSDLFFALSLAPMSRIVSLALPGSLFDADLYTRLLLVVIPLFVGLAVLIHSRGLAAWQNGLRWPDMGSVDAILWTVAAALVVPAIAFAEFFLLDPDLPGFDGEPGRLVFAGFILVLLALWQEMLFRGVILHVGIRSIGSQSAVLMAAVWFAILQIGVQDGLSQESLAFVGLAFVGGWVAAQQARATGSVAVSSLLYAVALVLYFLVLPESGL